ncbi:MAG: M23 family metallopeptidase [Candidatus Paceibacterota bacterium]|jgi:murein DD-endopeptidase MepM/ murein hydrolase activator NlpD
MIIINTKKLFIIPFFFLSLGIQVANASPSISITPSEVIQGEPVLIQIDEAKLSDIQRLSFEGKKLNVFNYKNKPTALLGIDLNKKAGDYKILLNLVSGISTSSILTVKAREKYVTYLAVPEKLGGNSTSSQTKVISTLAQENAILAVIKTFARNLWTKPFIYPISNPIVTDPYGFSRTSGAASITHKGADFKAIEGTKVVAMNRGIVRIARTLTVYGKIIVIDHGYGVMSFYIHLSKIKVNVGELVQQGQLIGYSGSTGYSTGPHLHLSMRIGNISIDPIKFLNLFTR